MLRCFLCRRDDENYANLECMVNKCVRCKDLRRVVGADGKGGVVACKEILMNDKTEHCGGVAALSGRCFLSPSHGHLPASCTYAPKNSDCTHMCPCA